MASGLTDRLNCRLVESRLHPWIGYRTTSRELRSLLREQAASLRQTVVAAARSNLEASRQTQSEIEARMLATARMLVELDRHHVLNQDTLDEIVRENSLFRVTVYGSDREQQLASAHLMWGSDADSVPAFLLTLVETCSIG